MLTSKFLLLKQREIIDILIGDTTISLKDGYLIEMPRLSGRKLIDRMRCFGFDNACLSGCSRWKYMSDLIDFAVDDKRESELLSYWFAREHFVSLTSLNNSEKIAAAYTDIIENVINAINSHLFLGGNKLVKTGNKFAIVNIDEKPIFELPTVKNI